MLTEGFGRFAAMMREPAFRLLVKPGASEIDIAAAAEVLARAAIPHAGPMLENLLRVQYRRMFEAEAIGVAERATGSLPGARQLSVAGSYTPTCPASHSLTQIRPRESDHTRRAPCPAVGGWIIVASPVSMSMRAMWLPANDA